jgi:transposase
VALHRTGRSVEELAAEFEPSRQTIKNWIKAAGRGGGAARAAPLAALDDAEREELRRLRREAKQLKQERDILAKGEEGQAKLVGAHGCGAGPVGEEVELALLDAVLHVAAGAVEPLVKGAGSHLGRGQRGHDETRVGTGLSPAGHPLGLGDDAALPAPAVEGAPAEIGEAASGTAGALGLTLRLGEVDMDVIDEAGVAREAEEEIHLVRLAQGH